MIIWDDNEREWLIEQVASMRMNNPVPSIITLVNHAQEQMPEDRRRQIVRVGSIEWLVAGVRERLAVIRERGKLSVVYEQRATDLKDRLDKAKEDIDRLSATRDVSSMTAVQLMTAAITKLEARIDARERPIVVHKIVQSMTIAPRATIRVVGLKGSQLSLLRDRMKDVRIVAKGGGDGVLVTRFVGHDVWDAIILHHPLVVRSSGGLDSWVRGIEWLIAHKGMKIHRGEID